MEALFAELKNQIGLRRLRLQRLKFVSAQVLPGSSGPEHQAIGAFPQPTDETCSYRLAKERGKLSRMVRSAQSGVSLTHFFNSYGMLRQVARLTGQLIGPH